MIKILFLAAPNPGSWLIRKALGEEASHVGIAIGNNEKDSGIFVHSYVKGIQPETIPWMKKKYRVVKCVEVPTDHNYNMVHRVLSDIKAQPYDYKALLFWGMSLIRMWITGKPVPRRNAYQDNGAYLCTKILKPIKDAIPFRVKWPRDLEMTTPMEIYSALKDNNWKESEIL